MSDEQFYNSSQALYSDDINASYRSPSKRWTAASFILIANLCEYICFYGISAIMLEYLTGTYRWDTFNAFVIDSLFLTLYLLLAILGGLLSDLFFHRILLICITYMCYLFGILGLVMLKLNTENESHPNVPVLCRNKEFSHSGEEAVKHNRTHVTLTHEPCYNQIILLVTLVSLGSGVSRVILSAIGADQVRSSGPKSVSIFFFINYLISQIGIIIVNVTLHQFDLEERVNYLIFLGSMLVASALFFICGRPFYEVHKHLGSVHHLIAIIREMWMKYKKRKDSSELNPNQSLVNLTKKCFGGSIEDDIVDGFKRLINVILMFIIILPFSMLQRMVKLMDVQSKHMCIPKEITFESTIYSFESLMIIVCIPIVIVIILTKTNPLSVLSFSRRLIIGMLCGLLSVLSSGMLETIRLHIFWNYNRTTLNPSENSFAQVVDNETYMAANMSVFWMTIPYSFMAISETLVFITAMEYVYLTCPPWLQCTGIGFMFGSWGLGSIMDDPLTFKLDGVLFNLMHINQRLPYPCKFTSLLTSNINDVVCWESRLDYIHYFMAFTAILAIIVICVFIRIFFPQMLRTSFMGVDKRLLGRNEDDIAEDEIEE